MMKVLFFIIFSSVAINCFGQFGLRATYNLNNTPEWNEFFSGLSGQVNEALDHSVTYSIDYWLRLPNHRIEFYPNISFHQSSGVINGLSASTPASELVQNSLRQFGFGLTTHFYVFDFFGDCECPTFSKQGEFFKKGFFLLAGVGADFSQKAINDIYRDGNFDFKASLGMGLDIGVSDLITISPFIQLQYFPSISWHELGVAFDIADADITTTMRQVQFGVRVGFRPDYEKSF